MEAGSTRAPRRALASDRASALMLVPACMLVVLCLLGIAVDGAAVHAAQRRLQAVCDSVADDAAGMVDGRLLQTGGVVRLDAGAAVHLANRLVPARPLWATSAVTSVVRADDRDGTVDLQVETHVDHLLLGRLPGGLGGTRLRARCRGRLRP